MFFPDATSKTRTTCKISTFFEDISFLNPRSHLMFDWVLNTPLTDVSSKNFLKQVQKQPSRGVLIKRCSENMQQSYRRTPMPKCDFNKVAIFFEITLWRGYFPVNLLHVFRTRFPKITQGNLNFL